jgi:F-type H+-transporting ATPase subunit delta
MAERLTVARPYAEAVFAIAQKEKALGKWLGRLTFLRQVCADGGMARLLSEPETTVEAKTKTVAAACGDPKILEALHGVALDAEGVRLAEVLIREKRIGLMPEIEQLFKELKDIAENTAQATIETAMPIDAKQTEAIETLLSERFGKKIEAKVEVKPELIGGVRLTVGDRIFDASVAGKLQNMSRVLHAR